MKKLALVIAACGLFLFGCKHQYWTMVDSGGGQSVAVAETTPEPEVKDPEVAEPEVKEPEVEPPTPKEIIFILGIDGMD